jgi:hypothetical protein
MHPKFLKRIETVAEERQQKPAKELRAFLTEIRNSCNFTPPVNGFLDGLIGLTDPWLMLVDFDLDQNNIELKYDRGIFTGNDDELISIFKVDSYEHNQVMVVKPDEDLIRQFFNSEEFRKDDSAALSLPIVLYLKGLLEIADKNIVGNFLTGDVREFTMRTATMVHEITIDLGELYWLALFLSEPDVLDS